MSLPQASMSYFYSIIALNRKCTLVLCLTCKQDSRLKITLPVGIFFSILLCEKLLRTPVSMLYKYIFMPRL